MAEGGRDGGRERELPGRRIAPGRCGFTLAFERVPALRAGSSGSSRRCKPRLRGRAFLIRYADDFVIGFRDERDAQRVHGSRAEAIRQVRPDDPSRPRRSSFPSVRRPWRRTTNGTAAPIVPGRSTCWASPTTGRGPGEVTGSSSRRRPPTASAERCGASTRGVRPTGTCSISEQQQKLNEKLRGHYAYYGVTGNSAALSRFLHEVERRWRKWLYRRNRKRSLTWDRVRSPAPALSAGPRAHGAFTLYGHAANP